MPTPNRPPGDPAAADRHLLLWAARRVLGAAAPHLGKIRVRVDRPGLGVVVTPRRAADGLADPEAFRPGVAGGPSASELHRVLFSRDEVRILQALVGHEPSKANDVLDRCRVEKTKFWILWSNLQHRGVVGDAEEGDGFVVLTGWVRNLVLARSDRPAGVRDRTATPGDQNPLPANPEGQP